MSAQKEKEKVQKFVPTQLLLDNRNLLKGYKFRFKGVGVRTKSNLIRIVEDLGAKVCKNDSYILTDDVYASKPNNRFKNKLYSLAFIQDSLNNGKALDIELYKFDYDFSEEEEIESSEDDVQNENVPTIEDKNHNKDTDSSINSPKSKQNLENNTKILERSHSTLKRKRSTSIDKAIPDDRITQSPLSPILTSSKHNQRNNLNSGRNKPPKRKRVTSPETIISSDQSIQSKTKIQSSRKSRDSSNDSSGSSCVHKNNLRHQHSVTPKKVPSERYSTRFKTKNSNSIKSKYDSDDESFDSDVVIQEVKRSTLKQERLISPKKELQNSETNNETQFCISMLLANENEGTESEGGDNERCGNALNNVHSSSEVIFLDSSPEDKIIDTFDVDEKFKINDEESHGLIFPNKDTQLYRISKSHSISIEEINNDIEKKCQLKEPRTLKETKKTKTNDGLVDRRLLNKIESRKEKSSTLAKKNRTCNKEKKLSFSSDEEVITKTLDKKYVAKKVKGKNFNSTKKLERFSEEEGSTDSNETEEPANRKKIEVNRNLRSSDEPGTSKESTAVTSGWIDTKTFVSTVKTSNNEENRRYCLNFSDDDNEDEDVKEKIEDEWWNDQTVPESDACQNLNCTYDPGPHKKHSTISKYLTTLEIQIFLKYLIQRNKIDCAKSNNIYKEMHRDGYLCHRSAETLRNFFRRTLSNRIDSLGLSKSIKNKIKMTLNNDII